MTKSAKIELLTYIAVSFTAVAFFWENPFLYPIKFFATAIHESCHALAAILTGGRVIEINLSGMRGHTLSSGGWPLVIIPAGYLGTSLIGALLVVFSRKQNLSGLLVLLISSAVLVMNFLYIDSYFGYSFWLTNLISIGLIFIVLRTHWSTRVTVFLGTFFAMASIEDARNYLLAIPFKTDAGIMARHIGLEFLTLPIAIVFLSLSGMIWWVSIKKVF